MSTVTTSNWLDLLDVKNTAEALHVGPKTVLHLCKIGKLRHVVIDGRGTLRIRRAWVIEYVERAAGRPVIKEAA